MDTDSNTYGDRGDQVILTTAAGLFDQWSRFEAQVFAALHADNTIARRVMLNVGAGRQIPEVEQPLFSSFDRVYLLEPDAERRAALAQNTDDARVTLLGERLEQLDAALIEPADYVQCKYVLQHLHTELLPVAVERLKATVAPGGVIAIFSSSSPGEACFRVRVPEEEEHRVPEALKAAAGGGITREQFNRLVGEPQPFPFIATHHLSREWLSACFADWNPQLEISSWGAVFLRGRRP